MRLFSMRNRNQSAQAKRLYAVFELVYTLIDFAAALSFLIGSIMFFYDSFKTPATWCFVIGSVLFATKPTLRVIRELRLAAEGDMEDLAERARN